MEAVVEVVQDYANRIMCSPGDCSKNLQRQLVLRNVESVVAPSLEFKGNEKNVRLNMVK